MSNHTHTDHQLLTSWFLLNDLEPELVKLAHAANTCLASRNVKKRFNFDARLKAVKPHKHQGKAKRKLCVQLLIGTNNKYEVVADADVTHITAYLSGAISMSNSFKQNGPVPV